MPRRKQVTMSRSKVKKELAELEGELTCLNKRFAEIQIKAEQEGISVTPELQAAFDKLNADVDKLAAQVAAGNNQTDVVNAVNAADAKVTALLTPTP